MGFVFGFLIVIALIGLTWTCYRYLRLKKSKALLNATGSLSQRSLANDYDVSQVAELPPLNSPACGKDIDDLDQVDFSEMKHDRSNIGVMID